MSAPDRLALVTGGCRRLGAALAARLAGQGYALALHATHDCVPEPALADAIAASGVAVHILPADLADEAAVEALVPRAIEAFGRAPDLLVNSASRFADDTPETVTLAEVARHQAVNAGAPAILARALARHHDAGAAASPALVVNILDQRIAAPNADQLSYTLSKLALSELTAILARHYAPRLRVCAIAPGLTIPTDDYGEGQLVRLAARMPLHRLPEPDDVAEALLYLVGARAVTGQTIFVDGGAHLCRFERDFVFLEREWIENRSG